MRRTTNPLLIAFRVPRGRDLIWTGKRLVIKLFAVEVVVEVVSGGGDDRRVNLSRGMELREVGSILPVNLPADTSDPAVHVQESNNEMDRERMVAELWTMRQSIINQRTSHPAVTEQMTA